VNTAQVALEDVVEADDAIELKELLERHALHTGSARARGILADWSESVKHFIKVMPVDYKKALQSAALVRGGKV
jgi:glutamate synthase domain-containing protein 3